MCMMLVPTISFADSSTVTLESILSANGIDINDFDGYELREVKRKSSNGVNAFSSIVSPMHLQIMPYNMLA